MITVDYGQTRFNVITEKKFEPYRKKAMQFEQYLEDIKRRRYEEEMAEIEKEISPEKIKETGIKKIMPFLVVGGIGTLILVILLARR